MENKMEIEKNMKTKTFFSLISSWSLNDIFNDNLLKEKVVKIPDTFGSLEAYFSSFKYPFLEEVRADMCSCLEAISQAPYVNILHIQKLKPITKPNYSIRVQPVENNASSSGKESYKLNNGDVIIWSNMRPKHCSDLNRMTNSFVMALVIKGGENDTELPPNVFHVETSTMIDVEGYSGSIRNKKFPFAVYLFSIVTYRRFWNALMTRVGKDREFKLLQVVLYTKSSSVNKKSALCVSEDAAIFQNSTIKDSLLSFNLKLNKSQTNAIQSCLSARSDNDKRPSFKLIWGPPGTGKTNTIAILLQLLQKMSCRTLTCAPTNTAVVQVVSRLLPLVNKDSVTGFVPYGDIVLFGNKDRLKIDNDLSKVFLDYRVKKLLERFAPKTGWKFCLNQMQDLFDTCIIQYHKYKEERERKRCDIEVDTFLNERKQQKGSDIEVDTFLVYVRKNFILIEDSLVSCFNTLLEQLPGCAFPNLKRNMLVTLFGLLQSFRKYLDKNISEVDAKAIFTEEGGSNHTVTKLKQIRFQCSEIIMTLKETLTRARHCLWIVGNGETLIKSGSIWAKLVSDSKNRGCYFDSSHDSDVSKAINIACIELGLHSSININKRTLTAPKKKKKDKQSSRGSKKMLYQPITSITSQLETLTLTQPEKKKKDKMKSRIHEPGIDSKTHSSFDICSNDDPSLLAMKSCIDEPGLDSTSHSSLLEICCNDDPSLLVLKNRGTEVVLCELRESEPELEFMGASSSSTAECLSTSENLTREPSHFKNCVGKLISAIIFAYLERYR